jgi:acyl-CoA thioester hydrolase
VISVAELFYGCLFDGPPQAVKDRLGFGTPTRALAFDFRGSLRPDDEFDMTVWVRDIRSRTYSLAIEASMPDRTPVFDALLTPICIPRGERRSIEIPAALRAALTEYQDRCNASGARPRDTHDAP